MTASSRGGRSKVDTIGHGRYTDFSQGIRRPSTPYNEHPLVIPRMVLHKPIIIDC
jgi:hypothetical protein